jgi:hypothetical protein
VRHDRPHEVDGLAAGAAEWKIGDARQGLRVSKNVAGTEIHP